MTKVTKDMIGCLCWFWNTDDNFKRIDILRDIREEHHPNKTVYVMSSGGYAQCCPVKSDEVRFFLNVLQQVDSNKT